MPSQFDDFFFDHDVVGRCYLNNPITGKRIVTADSDTPTECWIDTYGFHSAKAQAHRQRSEEKQRELGRDFTEKEREDDVREMLVKLTAGWQLVAPNGKVVEVECTPDNVREFYTKHDWVVLQLANFLGNVGNFLPTGWVH